MNTTVVIEKIIYILLMLYAIHSAAEDARFRQIGLRASILFAAIGVALSFVMGRGLFSLVKAMLPGIAILIMSVLTRGAVGIGDAVFTAVCACYLEPAQLCFCVALAWIMCAFTALVIIAKDMLTLQRNACAKQGLPFATYMLLPIILMVLKGMQT